MSCVRLCLLDGNLEGCIYLVDQLLVLTASKIPSNKLGSSSKILFAISSATPIAHRPATFVQWLRNATQAKNKTNACTT